MSTSEVVFNIHGCYLIWRLHILCMTFSLSLLSYFVSACYSHSLDIADRAKYLCSSCFLLSPEPYYSPEEWDWCVSEHQSHQYHDMCNHVTWSATSTNWAGDILYEWVCNGVCVWMLCVRVWGVYIEKRCGAVMEHEYACILIPVHTGQMWLQLLVSAQTYSWRSLEGNSSSPESKYAHCNSYSLLHCVAHIWPTTYSFTTTLYKSSAWICNCMHAHVCICLYSRWNVHTWDVL